MAGAHEFLPTADSAARPLCLTVTRGDDFEQFVRKAGRTAPGLDLPPPSGPPTPEAMAALTELAAAHGIVFHEINCLSLYGGRQPW